VANLVFDGRAIWFHSVDSPLQVRLIFDHVEKMISADRFLPPASQLATFAFNFYDWEHRQSSIAQDPSGTLRSRVSQT
jgi:cobaltochelatase CobN